MTVAAAKGGTTAGRARNRERVRQTLQRSAVRLIAEHGLDKVSVEQILSDAGYSRRTFYGYFANKLELLASVMNPAFDAGALFLESVLEQEPENLLVGTIECYLTLWEHHREALLAIAALNDPGIAPYIESGHQKFGNALKRVLRKAADAGLLRNCDAAYSFKVISRTAVPLLKIYAAHPDGTQLYRESMLALLQAPCADNQYTR